jgi:regulator of protease activity HflC (stomatin/prohibitin superfamily)
MSALSELLERLRRLRPPPGGPSGLLAVPSRGEDVAGEVAFLFATLDAVELQATEVRDSARAEAVAIEANTHLERERILVDADEQANRAWAALLAERRAASEREARKILVEAQGEAARVLAQGRELTPQLVHEVVRRIEGQAS